MLLPFTQYPDNASLRFFAELCYLGGIGSPFLTDLMLRGPYGVFLIVYIPERGVFPKLHLMVSPLLGFCLFYRLYMRSLYSYIDP